MFPLVFLVMPRLWSVASKHRYVTGADFVKGRYGSRSLATAIAFTGLLATMPYIALQLVGIEFVLEGTRHRRRVAADHLAFAILAAYTYTSGLRAPAMIALVKDTLIYADGDRGDRSTSPSEAGRVRQHLRRGRRRRCPSATSPAR